jgi:hypothetical protein
MTFRTEAFLRDIIAACKKHGCELSGEFAVHVTEEDFCVDSGASSIFDLSGIDAENVYYRYEKLI